MQFEYQNNEKDYLDYNKSILLKKLNKEKYLVLVIVLSLSFAFSGTPVNWSIFVSVFISLSLIYFTIYYLYPFLQASRQIRKSIINDQSVVAKKTLTMTEVGLNIESESKITLFTWESIRKVVSNDKFIYLFLPEKKYLLLPKRHFTSESESVNFLGLIESKIIRIKGGPAFQINNEKSNPPYLLGLLCIIPMVGAFVGLGLLMYGIFQYKDKWLIIVGALGIVWTMFVYPTLSNTGNSKDVREELANASQMEINSLFKNIEFYKLKYGVYPDSLQQITKEDQMAWINDPLQSFSSDKEKNRNFNYQKIGNHYYLFSSGIDGIPNTKDDIYPQVAPADSAKFGLIKKLN